jgi:hypothetical protein
MEFDNSHDENAVNQAVALARRLVKMSPGDPGLLCSVSASTKGLVISCITYEELAGLFWTLILLYTFYRFTVTFIDCVVKGCCIKN